MATNIAPSVDQEPQEQGQRTSSSSSSIPSDLKIEADEPSSENYQTPISPLSPSQKSPPASSSNDQDTSSTAPLATTTTTNEMQALLTSSDLSFPLEDSWTFWFFKNDRQAEWKDNLIKVTTVSTVEGFWSVYNHLLPASRLAQGCDYSLFKTGIQPMWEDKNNRSGGRWCLSLNKQQRTNELDQIWLYTMLSLIGDQYTEDTHHVNGCVVSIRSKADRIGLWTRDYRNAEVTKRVGSRFRDVADIHRAIPLVFESHEDQESKRGATTKFLFKA